MCSSDLVGDKASKPLKAGQTIAAHGTFDDGSETELGFFVVLRSGGKPHWYELAPLGVVDPYWADHLKGRPSVNAKVMSKPGEKVDGNSELLRRWRILAEPGVEPSLASFEVLGKDAAEDTVKKWLFLSEYVVADKQAG